jgi:hypothetical protein
VGALVELLEASQDVFCIAIEAELRRERVDGVVVELKSLLEDRAEHALAPERLAFGIRLRQSDRVGAARVLPGWRHAQGYAQLGRDALHVGAPIGIDPDSARPAEQSGEIERRPLEIDLERVELRRESRHGAMCHVAQARRQVVVDAHAHAGRILHCLRCHAPPPRHPERRPILYRAMPRSRPPRTLQPLLLVAVLLFAGSAQALEDPAEHTLITRFDNGPPGSTTASWC